MALTNQRRGETVERTLLDPVFRSIVEALDDGVYVLDGQRRIVYWNRAAERITGFAADEVIGRPCSANVLCHLDAGANPLCSCEGCPARTAKASGESLERELFARHREGHRFPVRCRTVPIRDAAGHLLATAEVFRDMRAQFAAEEEVERLRAAALLDPLTQLGNRRLAEMTLQGALADLARHGWPFAVAFADIDGFKRINDTFGHAVGDAVLRIVGRTLAGGVRGTDGVFRWGGEEFVAVLRHIAPEHVQAAANKLAALVRESLMPGADLAVTISIGATLAQADDTVDTLIERADTLMYMHKRQRSAAPDRPMEVADEGAR